MSEKFSWSGNFGRWWGVPLQVHLFFFLFAATVFCVEWHYLQQPGTVAGTALVTIVVVFFMALLHELAHGFAAATLGGRLNSLVITPWGGQSEMAMPLQPREQFLVHAAGPFFNAAAFAIGALLLTMTERASFTSLINPLQPFALQGGFEVSLMKIVTWVNFQMLIVNLIPAFPFDAQRMLRSAVLAYNRRTPALSLESGLLFFGVSSGLLLIAAAWLLRDNNTGPIQPTWYVLGVAGILVIFSARYGFHQEVVDAQKELQILDELMNYEMLYDNEDDEDEDTDPWLGDHEEGSIADWLYDQQSATENAERSVAIEEERRVDAILEKLHSDGIEALTDEERRFLDRISQQYRRRRELRS